MHRIHTQGLLNLALILVLSVITQIIQESIDAQAVTGIDYPRAMMVLSLNEFKTIGRMDLSTTRVERQGQDFFLRGLRVWSQGVERTVNARLRWFREQQELRMVEASIVGNINGVGLSWPESSSIKLPSAQPPRGSLEIQHAALENPQNGNTATGIAIIKGWAIAKSERSIIAVRLFVDGDRAMTIPCCSERADIQSAYPEEPNALNSGFEMRFNYGALSAGPHTIKVVIEDSAGIKREFRRGIVVRKTGGFESLDQLDFSNALVWTEGTHLLVRGAIARDAVSQQTAVRSLVYYWDRTAQAFLLMEEGVDDVAVTTLSCKINGDISSLETLKGQPGADGISLPEVIKAVNNSRLSGRVITLFKVQGTVNCDDALPEIQQALSVIGDVDNDGQPDVTIAAGDAAKQIRPAAGLKIIGSDVTIRGLRFRNFAANPDSAAIGILVSAPSGSSVANVSILGNEVTQLQGGEDDQRAGIVVDAAAESGQEGHLNNVLISGNRLKDMDDGIGISASGENIREEGLTLKKVTLINNVVEEITNAGIYIGSTAQRAILAELNIVDNDINAANANNGIVLEGGGGSDASKNVTEAIVAGNKISKSKFEGILIGGSFYKASKNTIMAEIRGNSVMENETNIALAGGVDGGSSNLVDVLVEKNIVMKASGTGIALVGGSDSAPENFLMANIRANEVNDSGYAGIFLEGGGGNNSGKNTLEGAVANNVIKGAVEGISLSGGFEKASENLIMGNVKENNIQKFNDSGIALTGGWSASDNAVDALVADNNVRDAGSGIVVFGGTTRQRDNNKNDARINVANGEILRNDVQESAELGISVFGGSDDSRGMVLGNLAKADVVANTADGIACEIGIKGNSIDCDIRDNTDTQTSGLLTDEVQRNSTRLSAISPALAQKLDTHRQRAAMRKETLQQRMALIKDSRLRERLFDVSKRLEALQDRLIGRIAGKPLSELDF
jgi:hypothetical protein